MSVKIEKIDLKFNEELIPLKQIENIIIHHTHNPELTVRSTHEMHINRFKWAGIGYNYFIEKDGRVFEGRGMYVGAHAKFHNNKSIGIALAGNFDVALPTKQQLDSLSQLTIEFMNKYDIEPQKVIGHREIAGVDKTCPGELFDMDKFRDELKKKLR